MSARRRRSNARFDDRNEPGRGRHARQPTDIPAEGWWDVAMRVRRELTADNVSIVAAGLALYALLAAFPALTAAVSVYGLFASPQDIGQHLQQVSGLLPEDANRILQQQLQELSGRPQALGWGMVLGVLIALWSARKGMVALMAATNLAYDEEERRGTIRQILVSLAFTVAAILTFLVVLLVGVAVPALVHLLPLGPFASVLVLTLRWVLLWLIAVVGLAAVYRYAPDRRKAQWRWITPGSAIAATLWLVGSILFALYVRNWGSYGQTYGALGGVVVLLMWFYLSGFTIFLGAEINAEMERQTREDTTEGPPRELGEREAHAADTVGPRACEL